MNDESTQAERDRVRQELISGTQTGKQVEIEQPTLSEVPTKEEVLAQESDRYLEAYLDLIYKFLTTPIIEDHFAADDASRDAWEKKVSEKYGDIGEKIISENRLRPNKLSIVYSSLPELADMASAGKKEKVLAVYQMLDKRPSLGQGIYKKLPNSEKRAIVKQFTLAAVTALQILAGREVPQSTMDYLKSGYLSGTG